MANETVFKYLCDTNRPYSANDIHLNLHKEFGKPAVQKALDALVTEGRIIEKVYGKQKIYCVKQEDQTTKEDDTGDIDVLIANEIERLREYQTTLKPLEVELKTLQSAPTTEELLTQIDGAQKDIEILKTKLSKLPSDAKTVTPEMFERLKNENKIVTKEYRSRKRICNHIIDEILEGYPNPKKVLIEEVGIETDESVGFVPTV